MTEALNHIHVIPENAFNRSYLERISRNGPAFTIATNQEIFRFWFDHNMRLEPFSPVITCQLGTAQLKIIVNPSLWNATCEGFVGSSDLSRLPALLAQAVIDAGAKQLFERFSSFLKQDIKVTHIARQLPDLQDHDYLGLRVTVGSSEGSMALCFAKEDTAIVEKLLGGIWEKIHPHFDRQSHMINLECAFADLSEAVYDQLAVGDVIFVKHVQESLANGFTIRLGQETFVGEINGDRAAITAHASSDLPDRGRPPLGKLRVQFDRGCQQLQLKDQSEVKEGFSFATQSRGYSPDTVAIRYEGVLFGKGRIITVSGRPAVLILGLGGDCFHEAATPEPRVLTTTVGTLSLPCQQPPVP